MGPPATLVKRLKYGGQQYLAIGAGGFIAAQVLRLDWPIPDLIIPVPIPRLRRFDRGFNQSFLLAQEMGKILGRPAREVLVRRSGDFSQAGLSSSERKQMGTNSFALKKGADLIDKTLLIVDDVMTTGSTLNRAAEALLEGHPSAIYGITLCC
jgi:ComF family protein